MAETEIYDVVILGAGPTAMAAGIYSARYARKTVLIGKELGGTCMKGGTYENWPGEQKIAGADLVIKFKDHLESYGVSIILETIKSTKKDGEIFTIEAGGKTIRGKTIILALGTKHRKLEIPGENELLGKGVSYCATCDGMFFKGKDVVAVIGGADSAAKAALFLSDLAKQVKIIYRKSDLRSEPIYKERIEKKDNIEIIYDSVPVEIVGREKVEALKIKDKGGEESEIKTDGVFIEIGAVPCNEISTGLGLSQDQGCYIKVNRQMETSIPGVFAAGDATEGSLKQVVTGAGEGAVAAHAAHEYLQKQTVPSELTQLNPSDKNSKGGDE